MSSDKEQIEQLLQAWLDATRTGDQTAITELMSDDVVFLMPGRAPLIGKAAASLAMKPPEESQRPQIEANCEIQELIVSGEWAFAWSKLSVVITPPDAPGSILRAGNTLNIFRKENGRWLLARDANMLTTIPPPGLSQ